MQHVDASCLTLACHDHANFHMQLESLKGTIFPYLYLNMCESISVFILILKLKYYIGQFHF